MAELTTKEKLQPSLLDRLTDDEPHKKQESRERRVLSIRRLRECVVRDLEWLLNSSNLSSTEEIDEYPLVGRSVVNYGMPDFAGGFVSSVDQAEIERAVRQVVHDFEPRILQESVKVRAVGAGSGVGPNVLTFEIEGQLWAQPIPEELFLKTTIDLETGSAVVVEETGRSD